MPNQVGYKDVTEKLFLNCTSRKIQPLAGIIILDLIDRSEFKVQYENSFKD